MRPGRRGERYLLYLKNSGEIEDFLARTGATHAAFDLMNAKIVREVRGNANRQMNCDMANVNKTLDAAEEQLTAIERLRGGSAWESLPEKLRQATFSSFRRFPLRNPVWVRFGSDGKVTEFSIEKSSEYAEKSG